MALEIQQLPISFKAGVDTKSDSKQIVPGKLLVLENASFKKIGKFIKRNGFGVLANTTALSNGNSITTFKNELISLDGLNVYSYSEHDDKNYVKGTKLAIDLSTQSIVRNSYEQTQPDSAIHSSGISVYAWQDSSGGIRYSCFDTITGQALVSNGLVSATGTKPKVKSIGIYVLILFYDGLVLKYFKVDSTLPTSSFAAVTLVTSSAAYFDVQFISSKLVIAYADSGSKTSLFSISTALVKSSDYQVNTPCTALSVFSDGSNNIWVAYVSGSNVKYFIVNFSLASTLLAPTTVEAVTAVNVTGVYNGSQATIFYEIAGTTASDQYTRKNTAVYAGTVGTPVDFIRSVGLFSKAFVHNSLVYVVVTHESNLQSTYFMCNESGQVVAKIAPSLGGGLSTIGLLAEVNSISSSVISMAFEFKDFVTSVNGDVTTQTGVNGAFLTFGQQIQEEVIGNNLHMSGGIVSMYDGQNIVEKGFNLYPEDITLGLYSGGGGLKTGSYQYSIVYEWTDGQGQIHRSAPSIGKTLDTNKDKLYSNGSTLAGTYIPDTANYEDRTAFAAGYSITGPGITGTATFIALGGASGLAIYPTPANASGNYILTSGKGFRGISVVGSDILTLSRNNLENYSANVVSGGFTVTLNVPDQVPLGVFLKLGIDGTTTLYSGKVIARNGNLLTVDTALPYTKSGVQLFASCSIVGTCSNGSPTLTGVAATSISHIEIGQDFSLNFPTRTGKVVSKTSTTITFDSNYTSNTVESALILYPIRYPNVGELYTENTATPAFGGSFMVVEVGNGFIQVDSQASVVNTIYFSTSASIFGSITIPTCRVTDKKTVFGNANIGVYRTTLNGSVFYRVNDLTSPIINDTTVDSVNFVDRLNDEILIGNEQLYTTGGELENISPPASSVVGTYKNRLLLRSDEDKLAFWYSKKVATNTPAEFTDAFVTRVPERGGDIVALQQMDDKLIIFKEDLIFVQVGDGPSPSGINNDFSDPQLITSDSGCINKKSVVLIPTGMLYQSSKGFYLLDRSLNMSYIGADVEAYNSDTVTSAKLMEDINQVRFTLSSGKVLTYDYYLAQWNTSPGINAADSTVYSNKLTYILPTGQVRKENTTYMDNTSFIPMKIETGWMNLAGLQGFQRVYKVLILGEYKSPHTLQVELFRDFNETAYQTVTIPVLSAPDKYQFRVFPNIQKCESLKIRITELQDGPSYGEGMELSSLALEVGVKRGLNKLSGDKSFG